MTHTTTPQKSSRVARKYTSVNENTMLANSPRKKVGTALSLIHIEMCIRDRPL